MIFSIDENREKRLAQLRNQAQVACNSVASGREDLSAEQIDFLIQSLKTYQIELELQNEELRNTQQLLQKKTKELTDLYDYAPVGYASLNDAGQIQKANQTLIDILPPRQKILGIHFRQFLCPEDQRTFSSRYKAFFKQPEGKSFELRLADGKTCIAMTGRRLEHETSNKPETQLLLAITDITEKKVSEEQILKLAHYDGLTNLPNRVLFNDRLRQSLHLAKRKESTLAVIFLDLDNFKEINDGKGHATGDLLLQKVAKRFKDLVRSSDTIARFGGDEFVFLLDTGNSLSSAKAQASQVANKIIRCLDEPFEIADGLFSVGASIGISLYPEHGETAESLIQHADLSMYQAKEAGGGTFHFFSHNLYQNYIDQTALKNDLKLALANNDLELYYQPKVRADGQKEKVVGFEALLRWNHPEKGLLYPEHFLDIAEETGSIVEIGEWVLDKACCQLKEWHLLGHEHLTMAANLSARQLTDAGLIDIIRACLNRHNLLPDKLEIEVTETVMVGDINHVTEILKKVRQLGVIVSLDDFGVGYSSLMHIRHLPADQLKIDKSFIKNVVSSADDKAIVIACVSLAKSLGLTTVAEGVEDQDQFDFVSFSGCDFAQGYYCSIPVCKNEIDKILLRQ